MADGNRGSTALEGARAVWSRRKWLAIGAFAGTFSFAAAFVMSLPNLYEATATVLVERQQVPENFVQPAIVGEVETRLLTISQEILSRARLQALIDRFGLYPDLKGRVPEEALVERMRRDIRWEPRGVDRTGGRGATIAFALHFLGRDPRTVTEVTNTMASFYVEENLETRAREATGAADFLQSQLEELKRRLEEQEQRLGDFKKAHPGELPEQVEVNLATLESLNARLQLNSENQNRARERREELVKQLAESGSADSAVRISKLKRDLGELRTRYSDKHPDVISLKSEIAALEGQFAAAGANRGRGAAEATTTSPVLTRLQKSLKETEGEIKTLKSEDRDLRRAAAQYQQRIEHAPLREEELRQLMRDYETTKELYSSMLKRYEEAGLTESMERLEKGEHFRILDRAIPPSQPAAPNRIQLLLVGWILALGAAAGLVLLAERLDTSFHTLDELRSFSRLPVLASIPLIRTDSDRIRRRRRAWVGAISAVAALSLIGGASWFLARGNEPIVRLLAGGRL